MITSSSPYPLSVLTGSHIDFVSLRVLALPGLYLRDKSNCLSLDRLLPLLPSVSLCAKICQVKSLHTLKSRLTTCHSTEHYRWLTYQQTIPTRNATNRHNTLTKRKKYTDIQCNTTLGTPTISSRSFIRLWILILHIYLLTDREQQWHYNSNSSWQQDQSM